MSKKLDDDSGDIILSFKKKGYIDDDLNHYLLKKVKNKKDLFEAFKSYFNLNTEKTNKIFLWIMNNENFENQDTFLDITQKCFFKYLVFCGGIVSSFDVIKRFKKRNPNAVEITPFMRDEAVKNLEQWITKLKFGNEHIYIINLELYNDIFKCNS